MRGFTVTSGSSKRVDYPLLYEDTKYDVTIEVDDAER